MAVAHNQTRRILHRKFRLNDYWIRSKSLSILRQFSNLLKSKISDISLKSYIKIQQILSDRGLYF